MTDKKPSLNLTADKLRAGYKPKVKLTKPKAKKDTRYVVKRGDNLSTIARRNGTTLAKILKLNPRLRANPNRIFRGTRVRLK